MTTALRSSPFLLRRARPPRRARVACRFRCTRGFTLAEVAVTIVIVGIGLLMVLQGLNTAKITAAHTRNYKLSRDLALLTLGQIESGEFQKDIQNGLVGTYAEQGYPDFMYEVIVGDATFREQNENGTFDSWAPTEAEKEQQDKDKEEEVEEPFEKVKIRITYPKLAEFSNELILERWMPWTQVYGEKEDTTQTASASSPGSTAGSGAPTGASSSTSK